MQNSTVGPYTILKTLNRGSTCKVKLAKTVDEQQFALKLMDYQPDNDYIEKLLSNVMKEVTALTSI